jgi:hypothetical protein
MGSMTDKADHIAWAAKVLARSVGCRGAAIRYRLEEERTRRTHAQSNVPDPERTPRCFGIGAKIKNNALRKDGF